MNIEHEKKLADSVMRSIDPIFVGKVKTLRSGQPRQVLGLIQWFGHGPRGGDGLELGSYCGESALIFLNIGARSVACVDVWNDDIGWNRHLESLDKAEMFFDHVLDLHANKITKHKGRTVDVLEKMKSDGARFDWVYIDAAHDYDSVVSDIKGSLPLLKHDGFIGGHDYLREGPVANAVIDVLGPPEMVFLDSSWIMKI
jgi:predicted O-methyltransferase YrrM